MNLIIVKLQQQIIPEWVLNRCDLILRRGKERATVVCHGDVYEVRSFYACRGYCPAKIIWTFDLSTLDNDENVLRLYLERFDPVVEYWRE